MNFKVSIRRIGEKQTKGERERERSREIKGDGEKKSGMDMYTSRGYE